MLLIKDIQAGLSIGQLNDNQPMTRCIGKFMLINRFSSMGWFLMIQIANISKHVNMPPISFGDLLLAPSL